MSRSRKKPWVKDKGMSTQEYWKPIRSRWKQHLQQNYLDEDLIFTNPKTIINDYDYCDWKFFICEEERYFGVDKIDISTTGEDVKKATRK